MVPEPGVPPLLSAVVGVGLFLFLLWSSWASRCEGETQAAVRLGVVALLLPLPFFLPLLLPGSLRPGLAAVLLVGAGMLCLALLLPLPGGTGQRWGRPMPGVDERDIMFSRAALVPGTERFQEYYRRRPEKRALDDAFRREPGLLAAGSAHFHDQGFAAADAAFWTIERLRPFVEGDVAGGGREEACGRGREEGEREKEGSHEAPLGASTEGGTARAGTRLGGERTGGGPSTGAAYDPEAMSRFLKNWAMKTGAHSAGVTRVRDYHLYTHVGRGTDYGKPVTLDHPFALALTVEMDREMVDRAPRSPTLMESALQYLRSGVMAVQLADLIRRLGYDARAHVDGNYRVICPLVARDAGLGEIGRMGLLMTPRLGPRVRIAVVTTDLPLATDKPRPDSTTVDFCLRCRKCADACPSQAIPFGDPEEDENGVSRWKIDAEACFTLWTRLGTDCARCMAVCPYSHPDNALHAGVRWGTRNNFLFRRAARVLDDLVYGRRPPPKEALAWMEVPEP